VRRVRLLHVPGCPGAELLLRRLAEPGFADVQVDREVMADQAEAAAAGMTGSPTLLIDGVDPFAVGNAMASLSCRLYRDEHDRLGNAPSAAQLRRALIGREAGRWPIAPIHPLTSRWTGSGAERPPGRPICYPACAMHQAILTAFLGTGAAPHRGAWLGWPAGLDCRRLRRSPALPPPTWSSWTGPAPPRSPIRSPAPRPDMGRAAQPAAGVGDAPSTPWASRR
jgi:hypothetical protein